MRSLLSCRCFFAEKLLGGLLRGIMEGFIGGVVVSPSGAKVNDRLTVTEWNPGVVAEEFDRIDLAETSGAHGGDRIFDVVARLKHARTVAMTSGSRVRCSVSFTRASVYGRSFGRHALRPVYDTTR